MPRAAGRATWQITAGLIIKNQHSPEGVAGEEEGYDGGGDSNKAYWASTDKGEGRIPPPPAAAADDKQEEFISITNGRFLEGKKNS